MKLSKAQMEYICRAVDLSAYSSHGVYFSLWNPGRTHTGRSLLRRGLIEPCSGAHSWPYQLTDAGVSAYMEISHEFRKQVREAKR